MVQPCKDPNFLIDFFHLVFLLCLYRLASDLAMIRAIKCEMNCGKASTTEAMRRDRIFANRLLPALERYLGMGSKTVPSGQSRSGASVQIYASSPGEF
jgi:hypothetical protein